MNLDEHGCNLCPELVLSRRCIVQGYGSIPSEIMLIGEAPGRKGADITGIPFTMDKSGVRMQQMLINLGLNLNSDPRENPPLLENCYITNIIKCCPPYNRNPKGLEILSCRANLESELLIVNPRVIVPVGRLATLEVFQFLDIKCNDVKIRELNGIEVQSKYVVVPMVHPSRSSNSSIQKIEDVLSAYV